MPLADVMHDALREGVARGDGDRDVSALVTVAMRRVGGEQQSDEARVQIRRDTRAACIISELLPVGGT
jgi:hypothetical protein